MEEHYFHDRLKVLIHEYVLLSYRLSAKYPPDERFGLISQDRRASVSVMLNYLEGYARMRDAVKLNFYETSFGSLKESIYVKFLAKNLGHITEEEYKKAKTLENEISAMLYSTNEGIRRKLGR
ncbi:MAG: four helix bundle protein [Candidatus Magasanikbacteria bacterium]|nr:four helix bundle protein [Candidatus Magasanikbacteria bacterium]